MGVCEMEKERERVQKESMKWVGAIYEVNNCHDMLP